MNKSQYKFIIQQKARELGFSGVSFAKAEHMDVEALRLEKWLGGGNHGTMGYMENHFELRTDPTKLVPGAKTVISLMFNYYNEDTQHDPEAPKLAMYAYGRDYHKVVKKKLKYLMKYVKEEIGDIDGRAFVDSAPILERDWARRSGMGWVGKHSLLLNPKEGSYFFLSEIICDLEIEPDSPIKDHCGTCTRCIEACPTDAISEEGYVMDGSKCISYLTIERKEEIPIEYKDLMGNYMFGCDICQQVCPWNRFAKQHNEPDFQPKAGMLDMSRKDWMEITEEVFDRIFFGSPVKRTGFEGLQRNLRFLNDRPND
ncbi:tRNA epoxyqueuosine(34) reductase QueG [Saprospiraceae bacterium]|nr:tRNA epoxyqueuosine(34) reductase QueG [Saprospiraceae bacterium]MDB4163331.1 tRNA epoxyqueuosine(34) reductase QueG [Saprospiraceae bacterium]MDC1308851.1 tRNA epoxyqueuosine(34) reductase QueG [Saprospiraceae bacterium]